jgi:hypothetical protein
MFGVVPTNGVGVVLSVPVTAYTVPETVPVVNVTVAIPLAFVVLVGELNDPFEPVLLHVTTFPATEIGLFPASDSCAVIVTPLPTTGP